MSFEDDLKINPQELDVEWLRQPEIFHKYSNEKVFKQQVLDRAKDALEFIRAETAKAIRNNPGRFGLDKVTEASLQETLTLHKGCRDMAEKVFQAKEDLDYCWVQINSLDQRRATLENLSKLYNGEYFSGPSSVDPLVSRVQAAEIRRNKANDRMADVIAKRRKA